MSFDFHSRLSILLTNLFSRKIGGDVQVKLLGKSHIIFGLILMASPAECQEQARDRFLDTLSYWDSLSTQLIFAQKVDSSKIILLEAIPLAIGRDRVDLLPFFYFKLGYIKEQKGHDPAAEYLEGLRIAELYDSKEWLGSLYQKVAYVEKNRGNSGLSVEYAKKAVRFTTDKEGRPEASSLVNLAWFLHEDKRPEQECVDVLEGGIKYYSDDTSSLRMIYHGFSEFYLFKVGDVHKAMYYLDRTLSLAPIGSRSKALANKAKALGMLEQWSEALIYHQKAMEEYFPDYESIGDHSIPDFANNKGFVQHWYPQQLAHFLLGRGMADEATKDLEQVIVAVDQSNEMLDHFRMKLNRTEKNVFSGYQRKNSELGVSACYELWMSTKDMVYLQKMLDYMERARSTILLEKNVWEDLFQSNEHIALAHKLSEEIQELRLRSRMAQDFRRDSLVSLLSEKNRTLEKVKIEIENESPFYFKGRYPSTISLQKISSSLESDQAIVNYFTSESGVYTLVVTCDTLIAIRTHETQTDSLGEELRNAIESRHRDYVGFACQLHEILIQPVADIIEERQWIVVKDYEHTLLPFDVLIPCAESNNLPSDPANMQYASSATLFFRNKSNDPRKEMLAFAPEFRSQQGIAVGGAQVSGEGLLGAMDELESVRSFFSGDFKKGKEATKEYFIQHASDYRYIHLATHAVLNSQVPDASHLLFSADGIDNDDNRLVAHELYSMQIPASLVTLSACNTGVGKLVPGEGAASLAKAFIYAGSENVLMSLWPVDDKITAELMRYFYRFFHKTRNASFALTEAKKKFVSAHPGRLKHPYYWSGFVVISSRWQEVATGFENGWLILTGIFSLLLIGYFCRRAFLLWWPAL